MHFFLVCVCTLYLIANNLILLSQMHFIYYTIKLMLIDKYTSVQYKL